MRIEVAADRADELTGCLFELGCTGIEAQDDETTARGPGRGLLCLRASFSSRAEAEAAARALGGVAACELGEIVGDAWRDAYKQFFQPFLLTESIAVAPPWADGYRPPRGAKVLWMDPGRAFGTGLHATTSLCAKALERHRPALGGARLLDVGTGSAILALCALLLGAAHAEAIDSDPDVIDVALQNADRNGLSARIAISGTPLSAVRGAFAAVVANIRAETLVALAPDLCARLSPGGLLVLGGILASERQEVLGAFSAFGLGEPQIAEAGDGSEAWIALSFSR